MYWKVKHHETSNGIYYIYKYFCLIAKPNPHLTYYDFDTKQILYPIKKELVIQERLCHDDDEFIRWYARNKGY